jgi:integrase
MEATMNSTAIQAAPVAPLAIFEAAAKAEGYARASKAENTITALRAGWAAFFSWCAAMGLQALPAAPETVALYLSAHGSTLKLSTLRLRSWAIGAAHRTRGLADPTKTEAVRSVLAGVARTEGSSPTRKTAATVDVLRLMVDTLPASLIGVRDRALLLVGFAGAFRRSELVGLRLEDVRFTREGLVLRLRRSKTDQAGEGVDVAIPYGSHPETCPVRALMAWIEDSGLTAGLLFRSVTRHGKTGEGLSGEAVAQIVKRTAEAAGQDPATFSGHSLRAGFATTAARNEVAENRIMRQTRHRSHAMLQVYIREGSMFTKNAAASVGL